MSKVLAIAKTLLGYAKDLEIPTVATAIAGILAPVIAGLFGGNVSAPVLAGWLMLVGTIAAALQKATASPPAKK